MPQEKNNNHAKRLATISDVERIVTRSQGEIIEAMNGYSQGVEKRFDAIDGRFNKADERFDKVETRLGKIESTMVTKDYLNEKLDDKMADLRGDLVVLMRKEDTKLKELVDILHQKRILK